MNDIGDTIEYLINIVFASIHDNSVKNILREVAKAEREYLIAEADARRNKSSALIRAIFKLDIEIKKLQTLYDLIGCDLSIDAKIALEKILFELNKQREKNANEKRKLSGFHYKDIGKHDDENGLTDVEQRNKFSVGDTVEIFGPYTPFYEELITEMYDENGEPVESAPHPQQKLKIRFKRTPNEGFIMRKRKEVLK